MKICIDFELVAQANKEAQKRKTVGSPGTLQRATTFCGFQPQEAANRLLKGLENEQDRWTEAFGRQKGQRIRTAMAHDLQKNGTGVHHFLIL